MSSSYIEITEERARQIGLTMKQVHKLNKKMDMWIALIEIHNYFEKYKNYINGQRKKKNI